VHELDRFIITSFPTKEYSLLRIQWTLHSFVNDFCIVEVGGVSLMLAAISFALSHRHTAETFLSLDKVHAMITACHMFYLSKICIHLSKPYPSQVRISVDLTPSATYLRSFATRWP